ncbi:MAG: 16S rRNA (guanine(527)-N(7))-methyltransferase RsmG [Lachnospiraceae bacterium]|nr:16S rRNA (guanine(527)-N(7))-methyltransferase RsmG [Lachnospiraceae bacterium]
MTEMFEKLMNEGLDGLGLTLSNRQKEQFYQYYELLIEWNKVMNLTAITELDEVVTKHFVDSLLLVKVIPNLDSASYKCIDVGTGAGFPGIPLKIAFPNLEITLLDSLNKRVGFLNEVIGTLGLEKIQAVHGRAEDYGRDGKYREQYDLCVSRAVANMSTLSEYCIPFVAKGGHFIPYKSGKVEEEVKQAESAVKKLGGEMGEVITHILPGTDVERTFIPVKKVGITAKKFPRKAGLPSKEPLK